MTGPPSPLGLTALHVAVNTECHEAVLLLLERGADIDAVVSEGARARDAAKRSGGPKRAGAGGGGRLRGWAGLEVSVPPERWECGPPAVGLELGETQGPSLPAAGH